MTKQEAVQEWRNVWDRHLSHDPQNIFNWEAQGKLWNFYMDMLVKEGKITKRQYFTWSFPSSERVEPRNPNFGKIYGAPRYPAYHSPRGAVWMWRKGQKVRFYTSMGKQVGPEQRNVAHAVAYAQRKEWLLGRD